MKNNERVGVDIRVALKSGARFRPTATYASAVADKALAAHPLGARGQLALMARRVARSLFALIRPLARPFAFRLRAYLLGPVQLELVHLSESIAQERTAARRWRETVEQLLSNVQASQPKQDVPLESVAMLSPRLSATTTYPAAVNGRSRLLEKLLSAGDALIVRLDAPTGSAEGIRLATQLKSQHPDLVMLIVLRGSDLDPRGEAIRAAWTQFFQQSELTFGTIHPDTGLLDRGLTDRYLETSTSVEVLAAPAHSRAWKFVLSTP